MQSVCWWSEGETDRRRLFPLLSHSSGAAAQVMSLKPREEVNKFNLHYGLESTVAAFETPADSLILTGVQHIALSIPSSALFFASMRTEGRRKRERRRRRLGSTSIPGSFLWRRTCVALSSRPSEGSVSIEKRQLHPYSDRDSGENVSRKHIKANTHTDIYFGV